MPYQGGDDPQLRADLSDVLRRWRKTTIGESPLAASLSAVARRREADSHITQASALRETLLAALARQRASGWGSHADLLRDRYVSGETVYRLQQVYNLSERSIYYRIREAVASLAHILWSMEQGEASSRQLQTGPGGQTPGQWRARHLPPPTYTFLLGVQDVLAYLLRCLNRTDGHWMISVDGMGGLGKTALVREAAACLAESDRFADIAWLTIRPECYLDQGAAPVRQHALTCDQVFDGVGAQLGDLDLSDLPLAEKRGRVGHLLRACSYLVVVDNLEMVAEYETVLDSLRGLANPSKFLFTSRCRMELDAYSWTVVPLTQLSEQHSLALIRHEGSLRGLHEVVEASDDALRAILDVTGGNPLAIKLVVGQIVSLPLSRVLSALADARPSADAFYEYVFSGTWGLLSAAARRLLSSMVQLPASRGTWQDLSAMTGFSDEALSSAIAELVANSLLDSAGLEEKTYTIHPLTHAFAARQAARGTGAGEGFPGAGG